MNHVQLFGITFHWFWVYLAEIGLGIAAAAVFAYIMHRTIK